MIPANREAIQKDQLMPYLTKWEQLKKEISTLHATRKDRVDDFMIEGYELFLHLLFHCHSSQTIDETKLKELEAYPLNGAERLLFIKHRPGHYVSFIQLDELYTETIKKLARIRVQK